MIWQLNHQALRGVACAAALLLSPMALAVEETTRALAQDLRALATLTTFGEELKAVISTDLGVTQAQVERWHEAVDAAFAADLLEADFLTALESATSDEGRQAAMVYERSGLAADMRELVDAALSHDDTDALIEAGRGYVESASAAENALLVDVIAAQRGPERDKVEMDVYFRAMAIMAEPIVGAKATKQWVESAQFLRDEYSEDNFLVRVAAYREVPPAKLAEVAAALSEPLLVEFSAQLVVALSETLHAAADRLAEYN